jgi:zinc protease
VAAAALADDFAPVLAIVADIVRGPAFPEADVATRRAELLTAIRQEDDDPASVAVHAFMRAAYDGHPYARRVGGTADSVRAVTRADLVSFHARHVTPTATSVVVVGSLPAPVMVEEVVRAFGDWAPAGAGDPGAEVPDPPVRPVRHVERIAMPDKAQAEVAYGFPGLRRLDPQYFAAVIMNNALGQYALGGRLGDSIRERQGMAYYVFSSLDAGIGPGPLLIRAGVAAANVERTIASIDAELAAVCGDGLTAKEVADSIQYMVGALPRQLETNAGIASFLLNAEVYGLGLDYDRRLPALLRAVTHDEAVAVARRLLDPSRATVVVAGPESPSRSAA